MNWRNMPTVDKPFRPCYRKATAKVRQLDIVENVRKACYRCELAERPVTWLF